MGRWMDDRPKRLVTNKSNENNMTAARRKITILFIFVYCTTDKILSYSIISHVYRDIKGKE